jgi:hypothetical protein
MDITDVGHYGLLHSSDECVSLRPVWGVAQLDIKMIKSTSCSVTVLHELDIDDKVDDIEESNGHHSVKRQSTTLNHGLRCV